MSLNTLADITNVGHLEVLEIEMASKRTNLPSDAAADAGTAANEVEAPVKTDDNASDAEPPKFSEHFRLPDRDELEGHRVKNRYHLAETGNMHQLISHLKGQGKFNHETLVSGEQRILWPDDETERGIRFPDLIVAFGVKPKLHEANGYVITQQGKPPDFLLEIGTPMTKYEDSGAKRTDYQLMGIPEYWRFDDNEDGYHLGKRLAGDRLVEGRYEPIDIRTLTDGSLEGYSEKLDLYLRWESGELVFYDPATGRRILTYDDQEAGRLAERARAEAAEARAEAAEAENRRLREQLRRVASGN